MPEVAKIRPATLLTRLRSSWPSFGIFLLFLPLSFTPLRALSLLAILYGCARLLPLRLGLLSKLVVSFLLFMCSLTVLGAAAWLFKIPLSSGLVLGLAWIALIKWWIINGFRTSIIPTRKEIFSLQDIAALLSAVVAAVILAWPLGGKIEIGPLSSIIMTGGDNSAHIEMLKINDLNKGYAIGFGNRVDMPPNNISYPQGWHLTGAFMKWLVEVVAPIGTSPLRILTFYFALTVLWFALLVFMIVRLALYVLQSVVPRASSTASVVASLVAAVGISGWLFSLFEYGFQTHVAALVLLLVEVLFLAEAYRTTAARRQRYLLGALLAVAGISFFWSFLLPIAVGLCGLAIVIATLLRRRLPSALELVGLVLLSWAVLFQPIMQKTFLVMTSENESIVNLRGNVVQTAMHPLLLTFLAITAYTYYRFKSRALLWVYIAAAAALSFSVVLMVYQLTTIGELRYYYFKSNYTYIVLSIIILAALVGDVVQYALARAPHRRIGLHRVAVIALCGIALFNGFWVLRSSAVDDFLYSRMGGVSHGQAAAIADVMSKDTNAGLSLLPIGSCNRGDDIRAAQLAHALIYNEKTTAPSVYGYVELSFLDKHYTFRAIREYINVYGGVTIISRDLALSRELETFLGSQAAKATIINLDTTLETEPLTQCPDRIRDLTEAERAGGVR